MQSLHSHSSQHGVSQTERSLAEQLQINDREIRARKDLLGLDDNDEKILAMLHPFAAAALDQLVDAFYERQLQSREISMLIGDAGTLQRLRSSMRRYILELFEGYYDAEYVNKRLRIGKVHHRMGVSPKLYVAGLTQLEALLIEHVIEPATKETDWGAGKGAQAALRKLLMFDMQMVFDTYISALVTVADNARSELQEYTDDLEEIVATRTAELQELSTQDSLTGLLNQRAFYDNLRRELAVAERNSEVLTLVYFDLNGFKATNDSKGHKEGDRLLVNVAMAITKTIRNVDFGCRYGGDEFCIIMPRTGIEDARAVFERVTDAFDQTETHGVTFSAGLAETGPERVSSMDGLVKLADTWMYTAKAKSKKEPGHHIRPKADQDYTHVRQKTAVSSEIPEPDDADDVEAVEAVEPSPNQTPLRAV